jgi:hypothetical protein
MKFPVSLSQTYLLDDGPYVWKALFVFRAWPAIPADHLVELCMAPSLHVWM